MGQLNPVSRWAIAEPIRPSPRIPTRDPVTSCPNGYGPSSGQLQRARSAPRRRRGASGVLLTPIPNRRAAPTSTVSSAAPKWMIAPRLANVPIRSASIGIWPASTIGLTELACAAKKSAHFASIGSTSAAYFAVSASAIDGGTPPTCSTVVASANSCIEVAVKITPPRRATSWLPRHHHVSGDTEHHRQHRHHSKRCIQHCSPLLWCAGRHPDYGMTAPAQRFVLRTIIGAEGRIGHQQVRSATPQSVDYAGRR